jgi:hypothetical protein
MLVSRDKRMGKIGIAPVWWAPVMPSRQVSNLTSAISDRGRGNYLGTAAGVILVTLPQSILSVMQIPEVGRQIAYGSVIIVMLLFYGRGAAIRAGRFRGGGARPFVFQ